MYQQKFYFKIYFKILNAAWIIASNSFQNFKECAIRELHIHVRFTFDLEKNANYLSLSFGHALVKMSSRAQINEVLSSKTHTQTVDTILTLTLGLVLLTCGKQKGHRCFTNTNDFLQ